MIRDDPFVWHLNTLNPIFTLPSPEKCLCHVGRGRHVTTTAGPVDVNVLALGEVRVGTLGLDAEGVGTEVVTLGLQQVGGQILGAVAVVEAEGSGESRQRDTPESRLADHVAPAVLSLVNSLSEEMVEQQVLKVGVVAVSVGDVLEENGADDAATAPHQSDRRLVQLPVVLLGGILDEHEALSVGNNLGGVQGLLEVIDEGSLVTSEVGSGATEDAVGTATLVFEGRKATGKDSLADQSDRHTEVQSIDGGPLAGALLAGLVEDLLNEGNTIVVVVVEDVASDFNEEGVQNTGVPLGEDITNLLARHTETTLHDIVGLSSRSVSYLFRITSHKHTSQISCMSPYSIPL